MFKKLAYLFLIFLTSTSSAFATSLYIAPIIMYEGISTNNVDYMAITPRLALGVGGNLNGTVAYLAGEIFGSTKGATLHNNKGGTPGLKPSYSIGISLLPGVCLDNTLLAYVRLGLINTHFDNLSLSRTGTQAGFGLLTNISGAWDVRGEYTYTKYNSITGLGSPKSDEYALGLLYRFG